MNFTGLSSCWVVPQRFEESGEGAGQDLELGRRKEGSGENSCREEGPGRKKEKPLSLPHVGLGSAGNSGIPARKTCELQEQRSPVSSHSSGQRAENPQNPKNRSFVEVKSHSCL